MLRYRDDVPNEPELTLWMGRMRLATWHWRADGTVRQRRAWLPFGPRTLLIEGEFNTTSLQRSDRLGSAQTHMAYGEGPTQTNAPGLATYWKDETGLDYADQRYYKTGWGRFTAADPYLASGGVESPGSWNRYAYVEGDPVNYVDPSGLARGIPDGPYSVTVTASAPGVPLDDIIGPRLAARQDPGSYVPLWAEREELRESRCELSAATPGDMDFDAALAEAVEPEEISELEELLAPDAKSNRNEVVPYVAAALTAARWSVYIAQTPTGQRYIGISTSVGRRMIEHGSKFVSHVVVDLPRLNYAAAKGVEQTLIEAARKLNVSATELTAYRQVHRSI